MDEKQRFSVWYWIGGLIILMAIQSFLGQPHTQPLPVGASGS